MNYFKNLIVKLLYTKQIFCTRNLFNVTATNEIPSKWYLKTDNRKSYYLGSTTRNSFLKEIRKISLKTREYFLY